MLGRQSLDFYLPKYNIAIECQGIQHFKKVDGFIDNKEFLKIQERDLKLFQICQENNINLYYCFDTTKIQMLEIFKKFPTIYCKDNLFKIDTLINKILNS